MKKINFLKLIPYVVAIIVFIAISLIYVSPIFDGKQLSQSDVIHYKGSSKEIWDYRNATGEEILWTNSMFGGMPAYQISVLYKTSIVPFFKNIMMANLPFPANILFALFLGFFILLLTLKTDPWLGIVGAIAFAFSSYFFIYLSVGHNSQALAIAFIPLVLSGILLTFKGKFWLGGALTALFMAIEINVNHVQMTYYMLMIIGFIALFEFIYAIKEKKLKSFFIALAVLIFAGIVSIGPNVTNLWTSSEYVKETIRGKSELTDNGKNRSGGLDKDYIMQWSYGIGETFTLMIPDAKGGESEAIGKTKSALENVDRQYREPVSQQSRYWGSLPFTGGPVYAGALIAFLFILGLFIVKGKLKWALFGVTVLAIMLSWGHNFRFLTDFFIDNIPYYNKFRAVSSILIIAEVTMPLLGILALKEIIENPQIIKAKKMFFFIALGLTAGLTLLFVLMPGLFFNFTTPSEVSRFNEYLKQGVSKSQIDAIISNLEIARMSIFKMSCLRTITIILIGAGLIWTYASVKKMSKYVLYVALGILILIDMVPIDKRYLNDKSFIPKKQVEVPYTASAADEFILQDTTTDYRVLNMSTGNFTLDASTSYYHKSLGGYHAAKLRRYQDLIDHRINIEQERLINTLKAGVPDVFGGKGVGSQGDGSAQFVAKSAADQRAVVEILERDLGLPGLPLTLGTGPKVRKALIPAAGFGTRLFPASKATKKELFPVVDKDGIAKPAILLIVEEALDAGIEEVVIVVQQQDLEEFSSFFNQQISIENYNKLPLHFQDYARRILEIGRRVTFVAQVAQEGFGHAVFCARQAIGDEPFLLMLGDHLYRSTSEVSCAKQVVEAYQRSGTSVVGLRATPESEIAAFGTATGVWLEPDLLLNITELAEKPTVDYARARLRVPGFPEGEYLTVFGQYVIKPQLFAYVEEHIRNNVRERGEFQLTSALDRLRQEDGFHGLVVRGRRFDIGLPEHYLETLRTFRES